MITGIHSWLIEPPGSIAVKSASGHYNMYQQCHKEKQYTNMKNKIKGTWAIVWRFLVALLIRLMRRTKVVDRKVEYIGSPAKPYPPYINDQRPYAVSVKYKTKILWYSPLVWIVIILCACQSIWDSGLKEFLEDNREIFKWSDNKNMSWNYKPDYVASNFRVKFDVWLFTIIEGL